MFGLKRFSAKSPAVAIAESRGAATDLEPIGQEEFHRIKQHAFRALVEMIDASSFLRMPLLMAREEIGAALMQTLSLNRISLSDSDAARLLDELCDDMLGFGPLERFLVRDDISDIMVNGAQNIFIEVDGLIRETDVAFRDNEHLLNICQRIVSLVGRRDG